MPAPATADHTRPADAAAHAAADDRAAGPRIVIAGVGLLTPLGHAAWPTFAALLAGRSLADRAAPLIEAQSPVDPVNLVRVLGGVSVAQHASTDPSIELAERAAREAALDARCDTAGVPAWIGASKGAVHALTRATQQHLTLSAAPPPANGSAPETPVAAEPLALGAHGYMTRHLAQRLGIAPRAHVVAACASSLTALDAARRALLRAPADAPRQALVLTAEAALLPQFVHSYRRLGVLAPLTPTAYRQRPLDRDRCGFMLAEAGCAVMLERLEPNALPQPGQIELLDTAAASDAHDLVRSDPAMPALRHIARELLAHRHVDVIHPHAPGTPEHDAAELTAYAEATRHPCAGNARSERVRERRAGSPDFYACKGALGHTLGASGLVSLVLGCLCLRAGRRPPMPWIDAPLEGVEPDARPCSRAGTHAVFAAGFAGHVAGAVIRRH